MNKQKIEAMCRKAGLAPAHRGEVRGVEILVADGFVSPKDMHMLKRFGVEQGEYPMGCFVTIPWAMKSEEKFAIAQPIFFAWNHDTEYGQDGKKRGRINAALKQIDVLLEQTASVVMHG